TDVAVATTKANAIERDLFISWYSQDSNKKSTSNYIEPIKMKFTGTDNYVATQDLMLAVNAAITLKRPLLVKGEPGTGKTMLAEEVAQSLGMPLLQWHI
ncbi:MAG: hypothetical protein RLZZ521_800, partial [Pseudomonadota bacterium]